MRTELSLERARWSPTSRGRFCDFPLSDPLIGFLIIVDVVTDECGGQISGAVRKDVCQNICAIARSNHLLDEVRVALLATTDVISIDTHSTITVVRREITQFAAR